MNGFAKHHVISSFPHWGVAEALSRFSPSSLLDMGGAGRTKDYIVAEVTNANLVDGVDATDLPQLDNSFDATVSIATLEHVDDVRAFLSESIRVARNGAAHWFPAGTAARQAEALKSSLGHHHPCVIPSEDDIKTICNELDCSWNMSPYMTIGEHLLLLGTINTAIHCRESFELTAKIGDRPYGYLLVMTKERQ